MLQTKFVRKIRTYVLCPVTFFSENRAGYEIRCENIVESDRLQVTTWRIHISCWLPKAKNTHLEYVTFTTFPLQQWLHKRASVSHYTCTDCLVIEFFFNVCVVFETVRKNQVSCTRTPR